MKMRPGEPPRGAALESPIARHKVSPKMMGCRRRQARHENFSLVPKAKMAMSHQRKLANRSKLALVALSIIILVQQFLSASPIVTAHSETDVAGQQEALNSDQQNETISESSTTISSSVAKQNLKATEIDTQQQSECNDNNCLQSTSTVAPSSAVELASATSTSGDAQSSSQQINYNSSLAPPGEMLDLKFPLPMRIIATLACLIIFTVGVFGNLLVPLVVVKTRYLRNSTNLFIINLSIADLLVLTVCMPIVLIELHSRPETWLLGEVMCKLSNYVEMLAANGSIFTILAISFERYYAICKPLKAGYKCTRLRATIIICLIWFLASILTSPILFMAKSSQTVYIDGSLVYNCVLETDTYWPKMYVFGSMFAFFCLPLVLLILVYFLISRRLIRQNIAIMDAGRYDDFNRHGSNGQSGTGFERHKRKPSGGKRTNLRKSKSSKPFFSLLGHNNARLGRQDRIKSDKEILRDQRHSMAVDKINSVLISQLDVSKRTTTIAGQMLSINKTKSLDCQERKDMGGDIIAPIEEVDAISVSQSTWLHSNETNSDENNHLADIIVNETDSPKESSRSLNGFFSQLFSNSMFRFARGARKNSVEDPPSSADKMDNSRFIGICKPAVTMLTRGTESINCNGHSAKRPDTPRPTHSRLMNAASCPTATAAVNVMFMKDCRDSTGAQVASLSNGNGSIPSQYAIHCQDKCSQLVTRSMWSKRRMLESKKKQSHDTKGVQVQSKFKWIKNSSISSGTGSTYTNSTLLTSETSSKNESLRKYSRYNGGTPQSNEIHDDSSNSRTTPIKAYRKKSAHFNDCNAAIEPKLTQAYATLSTNSYSFSVSGDADNISENSSSPECLSTAPDDSKSSWLASVALHEHQSQHGASAQSNSESGCNVSGEMIKASKDNVNGENCALERDYANSRPASQNSSDGAQNDDCFNSIHSGDYTENCITEERLAGDNKFGCKIVNDKRGARQKIVRSLTDDRQPYGRTKLKTIQTGIRLPSEKSNCDLKISNSTVKHTGKKSLVTLAHNLSDNFNLRINKRRSGSQPLVTNQLSVNGTSEFFAVRDASKKQQMESRRQVVMMLAFVVACFFLLFFPYRVFTIWLILSTEDQVQSLGMETYYNLTYFSRILIYLHSAINPIAYNLISTKFRRAFMSILLCRGSAARRNFNYETYRNINVARSTRNKNKADSFTRPLKS